MPLKIAFTVSPEGCWICTSHSIQPSRHRYFSCRPNGPTDGLHRHMYRMCYGEIPKGSVIRHTCDNRFCINPGHLLLGTHADNVMDRVNRGRSATGEDHGRAKLTAVEVLEIFTDRTASRKSLAHHYRVDPKVIYDIHHRITWRRVTAAASRA